MKGLFKRGNIWWIRFTPTRGAAQVQLSTGIKWVSPTNTGEAEAIEEAEGLIADATFTTKEAMESCTAEVQAYLAKLKRDHLAKETIKHRGYILNPFIIAIGVPTPREITLKALQDWFDDRWDDNPHTAVAYLTVVSWWLAWMVERGKIPMNHAESVHIPQKLPMQRRRRFLKPAEARKVIDECEDPELKFVIYCAMQHGFRKKETIEAPPEWFDITNGLIHIVETDTFEPKDRDKRTIPMTDEFREWLKSEYGLRSPFMIQPEKKHQKYRYRYDFRAAFEKHMEACGLADVTFHDLRRTFASLLVSGGVSVYKVAKWLGDTIEQTEDTYGHLVPQDDDINPSYATKKSKGKKKRRPEAAVRRPPRRRARSAAIRTRSR